MKINARFLSRPKLLMELYNHWIAGAQEISYLEAEKLLKANSNYIKQIGPIRFEMNLDETSTEIDATHYVESLCTLNHFHKHDIVRSVNKIVSNIRSEDERVRIQVEMLRRVSPSAIDAIQKSSPSLTDAIAKSSVSRTQMGAPSGLLLMSYLAAATPTSVELSNSNNSSESSNSADSGFSSSSDSSYESSSSSSSCDSSGSSSSDSGGPGF